MTSIELITVIVVVVIFAFALLGWKEKATDEREDKHRHFASRMAFLTGTAVLTTGIIYQALLVNEIDFWLVLALVVMIASKALSRFYSSKNH